MKGGSSYSLRRRHISLALVALVLFTTLLWTWERNPIAMTIRSAQEWYRMPSEFPVEAPSDSVGTPTLEKDVEKSLTPITENGTKLQLDTEGAAAVDSVAAQFPEIQYSQSVRSSSSSKVCNYAKGKWVADSRRPLYSGFNCKQWLSAMWSCRMTQRPDFSFEGYRWQPENCDMPEFDRSAFLRKTKQLHS